MCLFAQGKESSASTREAARELHKRMYLQQSACLSVRLRCWGTMELSFVTVRQERASRTLCWALPRKAMAMTLGVIAGCVGSRLEFWRNSSVGCARCRRASPQSRTIGAAAAVTCRCTTTRSPICSSRHVRTVHLHPRSRSASRSTGACMSKGCARSLSAHRRKLSTCWSVAQSTAWWLTR